MATLGMVPPKRPPALPSTKSSNMPAAPTGPKANAGTASTQVREIDVDDELGQSGSLTSYSRNRRLSHRAKRPKQAFSCQRRDERVGVRELRVA